MILSKIFIEYSNDFGDIYQNIEESDPSKKHEVLIVFEGMVTDMLSDKKLHVIVTELFTRGRKLNISVVFTTQFYFDVPENIRLISTHYFIMKILNKQKLKKIEINNLSQIDVKDFMNYFKKCTVKAYSFLVNDTTLTSDNPL